MDQRRESGPASREDEAKREEDAHSNAIAISRGSLTVLNRRGALSARGEKRWSSHGSPDADLLARRKALSPEDGPVGRDKGIKEKGEAVNVVEEPGPGELGASTWKTKRESSDASRQEERQGRQTDVKPPDLAGEMDVGR